MADNRLAKLNPELLRWNVKVLLDTGPTLTKVWKRAVIHAHTQEDAWTIASQVYEAQGEKVKGGSVLLAKSQHGQAMERHGGRLGKAIETQVTDRLLVDTI